MSGGDHKKKQHIKNKTQYTMWKCISKKERTNKTVKIVEIS